MKESEWTKTKKIKKKIDRNKSLTKFMITIRELNANGINSIE